MTRTRRTTVLLDLAWLLIWGLASSAWCLTAARELGGTFDEPVYLNCGLEHWHTGGSSALMRWAPCPCPSMWSPCPFTFGGAGRESPRSGAQLGASPALGTLGDLAFLVVPAGLRLAGGASLGGRWAGRLVVPLLAWEPSFLAHASLATTDLAISACLLALVYHFRRGRDRRGCRVGVPALWFGLSLAAKASPWFTGLCACWSLGWSICCESGLDPDVR